MRDVTGPQPGVWPFGSFPQSLLALGDLSVFHPLAFPSTVLVQMQVGYMLGTKETQAVWNLLEERGSCLPCIGLKEWPPVFAPVDGHLGSQLAREKLRLRRGNGLGCV